MVKTGIINALVMGFLVGLIFINCKSEEKKSQTVIPIEEEILTETSSENNQEYRKMEIKRSLAEERTMAQSMMDDFLSKDPEPMQLLISGQLKVNYIMIVNEDRPLDKITGERMKFDKDFNYSWVKGDTLFQSGKYLYSMESDLLLLLSDNEKDFPSQWTVKSAGDIVLLVGTSKFKNNNTQIHMERF